MAKQKRRFPLKLPLLPGKSRKGEITVESEVKDGSYPGRVYLVQWAAEFTNTDEPERFIYDRNVLSAETIMKWTGVDVEALADG